MERLKMEEVLKAKTKEFLIFYINVLRCSGIKKDELVKYTPNKFYTDYGDIFITNFRNPNNLEDIEVIISDYKAVEEKNFNKILMKLSKNIARVDFYLRKVSENNKKILLSEDKVLELLLKSKYVIGEYFDNILDWSEGIGGFNSYSDLSYVRDMTENFKNKEDFITYMENVQGMKKFKDFLYKYNLEYLLDYRPMFFEGFFKGYLYEVDFRNSVLKINGIPFTTKEDFKNLKKLCIENLDIRKGLLEVYSGIDKTYNEDSIKNFLLRYVEPIILK